MTPQPITPKTVIKTKAGWIINQRNLLIKWKKAMNQKMSSKKKKLQMMALQKTPTFSIQIQKTKFGFTSGTND